MAILSSTASIENYLKINSISEKSLREAAPEQKRAARLVDDKLFYNHYYASGLDEFIECVDFRLNLEVFRVALDSIMQYKDIFEPCCQSGIFGCYITGQTGAAYKGMDKNAAAVSKAKARALHNGLTDLLFVEGDVFDYDGMHEALTGRYVANDRFLDPNQDMIDKICSISENIVLVQCTQPTSVKFGADVYRKQFERRGYSFDIINSRPLYSDATGEAVFVLEAHRRK